ncbi:MAG: glycosyltransferase [Acidobacteria bacterium]|nr:MAG: glycosyltransferase [Acidobacteriota bacterium]
MTQRDEALTLSVIVPVYNERYLVAELLRRVLAVSVPGIEALEIVVVDDCSTDGSREVLERIAAEHPQRIRLLRHPANRGKGAAIRTGIAAATGDLIIFQDADLEYDPRDYAALVKPILEDGANVVYGSRFLPRERRRVLYYRHTIGNRLITFLSNLFTDLNLTDVETCYKLFQAPLLKSIPIRSNDFAMEVELTAKIAKRNCRIFEVPISYLGRTYREGKKIGLKDAFKALVAIVRFWLVDDVYVEDQYGSNILQNLERVRRFNGWMADRIRPFVGSRVMEVGAGIGNVTLHLVPRDRYLASDVNPHYLEYLRHVAIGKPYLEVARVDLEDASTFAPWREGFDTVVCLNVLEHVKDPLAALRNVWGALAPGGRLVLYVPQGQGLFSTLDEVLEHRCRYSRSMLEEELAAVGFEVERVEHFNRASVLGWWWNGKVLKRRRFSRLQLKIFDLLVPLLRRLDRFLPWRGLGLIAVARKPAPDAAGGRDQGSAAGVRKEASSSK